MTERKDVIDKFLNGKTTTAGVLGILVILGLNSLGIGGSGQAASKNDVQTILNPIVAKMYERSEQTQTIQAEIISNQKLILIELRLFSENNLKMTMALQEVLGEVKEIRRRP